MKQIEKDKIKNALVSQAILDVMTSSILVVDENRSVKISNIEASKTFG